MGIGHRVTNLYPVKGTHFSHPLVLFQSDDWGLIGIRDKEGFDQLKAAGLEIGDRPYDFYSLETAEDLHHVYEVLLRHHDSIGRPPCLVFNFILSNVDFAEVMDSDFTKFRLLPLDQRLPAHWKRPGLLQAYREGVQKGLIYPALHGVTHFCRRTVERVIRGEDGRKSILRKLYSAGTPMIPQLTSWMGFEYRGEGDPETDRWLDFPSQKTLMEEGRGIFERMFGHSPFSACAPGYRANEDTLRAWKQIGIQVVQNGPGLGLAPFFDRHGLLHLHRNIPFEPFIDPCHFDLDKILARAEKILRSGRPAIVCTHSLNFQSTLKNQREATLQRLDEFLSVLERRYKDLLYANDFDLWRIIQEGECEWNGERVTTAAIPRFRPSPALNHYLKQAGRVFGRN